MSRRLFSAILVMDSRKMVRALRSQNPPLSGWSRLYQAGPYYLDMSFKPETEGIRVLGQVASTKAKEFAEAPIRLYQDGGESLEGILEPTGRFAFSLAQTLPCCLEVEIGQEIIRLDGLDLE